MFFSNLTKIVAYLFININGFQGLDKEHCFLGKAEIVPTEPYINSFFKEKAKSFFKNCPLIMSFWRIPFS